MRCLRRWMCVLFVLVSAIGFAQQITGDIRGTVSDTTGAMVQRATVTAQQVETGLTRTTTTDGQRHVRAARVAGGALSAGSDGTGIPEVPAGRNFAGCRCQRGGDGANAAGGGNGNGAGIFSQLGLLQPGVVPLTAGLREAGGSLRDGQAYAVNGQRPESNNFLIDGANNVNSVDAGFVLRPPIDASVP